MIFNEPGLVVSLDETSVSLSIAFEHLKSQRIVSTGPEDQGWVAKSEGLPNNSLLYARNGRGQLLPSLVVVGGRKKLPADFPTPNVLGGPSREVVEGEDDVNPNVTDAAGQPLPTLWRANEKGSVDGGLLLEWFKFCLIPSLEAYGLSAEKPAVLIVDGVQTHISLELAEYFKSQHGHEFLRPPHTSDKMQGEDTVIFSYGALTTFIFPFNPSAQSFQAKDYRSSISVDGGASDAPRCRRAPRARVAGHRRGFTASHVADGCSPP